MPSLYQQYQEMVAEAQRRAGEPWFLVDRLPGAGTSHERTKFLQPPSPEVLDRFRNYKIGGIGIETADYGIDHETWKKLPEFAAFDFPPVKHDRGIEARLTKAVQQGISDRPPEELRAFMKGADDSIDVGGLKFAIRFNRLLICSPFSVRMAQRVARLARMIARHGLKPDVLLELGGGHGKTFGDVRSLYGVRTGIYVDLPLNLALAASYLNRVEPGKVNLVWTESSRIEEGMMNLVVPWLLFPKLTMKVDLTINFLSLQHMQAETQEFYLAGLRERTEWLYHENRIQPRDAVEGSLETSPSLQAGQCLHDEAIFRPTFMNRKAVASEDLTVYGQLIRFG